MFADENNKGYKERDKNGGLLKKLVDIFSVGKLSIFNVEVRSNKLFLHI